MTNYFKILAAGFTIATAPACAPALHNVNLDTCMQSDQHATSIPLIFSNSARKDTFNSECGTAQAAMAIAQLKTMDGNPDPAAELFALNFYHHSNPKIRDFMDQMLKEQEGLTVDQLAFKIQQGKRRRAPYRLQARRYARRRHDVQVRGETGGGVRGGHGIRFQARAQAQARYSTD